MMEHISRKSDDVGSKTAWIIGDMTKEYYIFIKVYIAKYKISINDNWCTKEWKINDDKTKYYNFRAA